MLRVIVILGACLCVLPAAAQTRADLENDCVSNDVDARVSGCGALIDGLGAGRFEMDTLAQAKLYFFYAQAQSMKGNMEIALDGFSKSIAASGQHPQSRNERALIYEQAGKFDEALEDYTVSLGLNDKQDAVYFRRAHVFGNLGKIAEAKADVERAIELHPEHAAYHFMHAQMFQALGKPEQVVAELTMACELAPAPLTEEWQQTVTNSGHYNDGIDGICTTVLVNAIAECFATPGC